MNPHRAKNSLAILLVDDDADSRWLVRESLLQRQVDNPLFESESGDEALAFLLQRGRHAEAPRPGVVFLDIEMPGMDGQEVLLRIKKTPELNDIPVVMLTALNDDNHRQRAISNGALGYIVKPDTLEQLGEQVASAARGVLS